MRKISLIILATIIVLPIIHFVMTGFNVRTDIVLHDFLVSEDGSEVAFETNFLSPMGFIRGYKDNGGGVKPHYLTFYSTFGGLHSTIGAKNKFILKLDKDDNEIYFNRANGGYELVLQKNKETGEWVRP